MIAIEERAGGRDTNVVVDVVRVHASYPSPEGPVPVLTNVSFSVARGEMFAIVGVSGSGKTTLLNLIGALDTPASGDVRVLGQSVSRMSARERRELRRTKLGFIFQFFNLLPTLTAAENVKLALELVGAPRAECARAAQELLGAVGLAGKERRFPAQLSGGEQQRVAIARALAKRPELVVADEPTGNLDRASARQVLSLMRELNRNSGVTFVVVTHDPEIAKLADRVFELDGGGRAAANGAAAGSLSEGAPAPVPVAAASVAEAE